jgi:hypothetical protein
MDKTASALGGASVARVQLQTVVHPRFPMLIIHGRYRSISKAPWNAPRDIYVIVALDQIGDTIETIEKYMDIPFWF